MAVIPIIVICRPKREARVAEIVAGIIRYAIKIVVSLSQRQSTITCSHGCKYCGQNIAPKSFRHIVNAATNRFFRVPSEVPGNAWPKT